jgi:large subunit ribosomal protein L17|tara:strand:- start:140 stop:661 length:522 start_codon:yes stop_codon:yes gene_type:complete
MRHRKKSENFSRSRAQKKALVKALLRSLIINERIVTTTSKAKYLRGEFDRLLTWSKRGRLHDKRLAYQVVGDHKLVRRLFEAIAPRYPQSTGGYTRVLKVGRRKGDGAQLSLIELTKVERKKKPLKEAKDKETQSLTPKKVNQSEDAKDKTAKKGIISGVKKIFKKERNPGKR